MLKFIDLNNGYLYDGTSPYIHWFPGEQSTDLIYTHKICMLSDSDNLTVNINSDIFNLLDTSKLSNDTKYDDIISKSLNLTPHEIIDGYNIYILHISAKSEFYGEYRTDIIINDSKSDYKITIGADFYMENESLYINLSNMGIELPDAIQKVLYNIDIKEGYRDNITLNRKMKELLSNYWDVIANKGSYKSLLNSLKWFEWGDLIRLQEIWKHEDFGRVVYDDRSLCSILEDKYLDTLNEFSKTTHLSIYLTLQEFGKINNKIDYTDELNPKLINKLINKWSIEDLMLKICLLGNFYETYFMPIHLNLFQSTVENIVFTNTFKLINSMLLDRNDHINNIYTFDCNIKDNDSFILKNVRCQVGPNTIFGSQWTNENLYDDINIIGVDEYAEFNANDDQMIPDSDLKTFYSQIFNRIGSIVPFKCTLKIDPDDYIIESKLLINDNQLVDNTIFKSSQNENELDIYFNILFQKESNYNVNIQFKTAGSKIYTKSINISIHDVSNMDLSVYKIKHYKYLDEKYINMVHGKEINHLFNRYFQTIHDKTIQYIPTTSSIKSSGVCLNNVLVLKGNYINDYILNQYYFMTLRNGKEYEDPVYTVCISKSFWFDPNISVIDFNVTYGRYIYRNDYGFFPEFHYLEEIEQNSFNAYKVYDEDTVVIVPELPIGLEIDDWSWEFTNISRNEIIKLPNYQEPFVANLTENPLSTGYYDVKFRYRIGQDIKEITRQSIFIKIQ